MVEASFNLFDIIVLSVIGLSAALSFVRGFVRELLSLGAWVGALIVTLYAFPEVAAFLADYTKSTMIASGLAGVGTFMLSLIVISVFTSLLMKMMKPGSDIGLLDNALGLVFGAARGAILVALGFIVCTIVMPKAKYEEIITPAMSRPYVEKVATFLIGIAPEYIEEMSPVKSDGTIEEPSSEPKITRPDTDDAGEGQQWDSMDKLQRMIEEKSNEQ